MLTQSITLYEATNSLHPARGTVNLPPSSANVSSGASYSHQKPFDDVT
jgi:hypothetical protein